MNKFIGLLSLAALLILQGCAQPIKASKTSLELQAFQSQEFEAPKSVVFASTVSVFQDLGYAIANAHLDTGLINAESPTQEGFALFVGQTQDNTVATAFVEEIRKGVTKVRLNFVRVHKTSSGYGMAGRKDTPIEDAQTYQNAFLKIKEAVFIRTAQN